MHDYHYIARARQNSRLHVYNKIYVIYGKFNVSLINIYKVRL